MPKIAPKLASKPSMTAPTIPHSRLHYFPFLSTTTTSDERARLAHRPSPQGSQRAHLRNATGQESRRPCQVQDASTQSPQQHRALLLILLTSSVSASGGAGSTLSSSPNSRSSDGGSLGPKFGNHARCLQPMIWTGRNSPTGHLPPPIAHHFVRRKTARYPSQRSYGPSNPAVPKLQRCVFGPSSFLSHSPTTDGEKLRGRVRAWPPVKNAIALDDAESNVPEEPWEYISSA